jgi:hypothetical protein
VLRRRVFELELCGLVLAKGVVLRGEVEKRIFVHTFLFGIRCFRGAMGVSADYGLEFIY